MVERPIFDKKRNMKRVLYLTPLIATAVMIISACASSKKTGEGFNLFTVEQDKQLGAQVASEIDGNPQKYPVLDSASNKEIYAYIYKVRNAILNSGAVNHRDDFTWRVRIIKDDKTLNAFCTPGGYIYVYTGILKYLDNEAQLAGVMGHEIAHAAYRHSTRQMTKLYGVDILVQIIAGDRQLLKQVTEGLIGLKFSRQHETEADEGSVNFLCPTPYKADGGAGFFEKMMTAEQTTGRPPEFLSTHPNPENRIEHFHQLKIDKGCQGNSDFVTEYKRMVAKLP